MESSFADLLTCPACSGDLLTGERAVCSRCGTDFMTDSGIVSLIAPGAQTTLDEKDYDAMHRVTTRKSVEFAGNCIELVGDRLPPRIGTYMEVGAGTGLFTLGFLKQVEVGSALLTDISPGMLEICRRRLVEHGLDEAMELRFATWDGADCLRPRAFDLIAGFSVLHHVLDYQDMLAKLAKALRPNGMALFLEPNYRFHLALVDTVCEIFATIVEDHVVWTAQDKDRLSNWLFENNTNLRYRGDEQLLADREDKHLFDGTQLRAAAQAVGFHDVTLLPFGDRTECYHALKVYSGQMGLHAGARQDLLKRYARMLPGQFEHLADEDSTPSALIILGVGHGARSHRPAAPFSDPVQLEIEPQFRYDLSLTIAPQGEGWTIAVTGWLFGDADINYLRLDLGNRAYRFPVRCMREDVNRAFNSKPTYPMRRALFSGLDGRPQPFESSGDTQSAQLVLNAADGRDFVVADVVLAPEASTHTFTRVEAA